MAKKVEDFDANLAGEEGQNEEAKTSWFKRIKKGILTTTAEKKETPEGLWVKCPECNYICTVNELREHLFTCPKCNHHHRIGSDEYFEILFDNDEYVVMFENIRSKDFLHYEDKGFIKAIAAKIVQEPIVQCNCGLFLCLQNPSRKHHGKSR